MKSDQVVEKSLALITGSAHRLGRVIALKLARMGYDITLHYNQSFTQAQITAEEIRQLGVHVRLVQSDLTHAADIDRLFSTISQEPTPLRILVNSAAIMPRASLMEMDTADWDEVFHLNLRAAWLCSKYAANLMRGSSGLIINLTDAGVSKAWTNFGAYLISKSALETLTRLLARSLAPAIRVNGIAPGLFLPSTGMPDEEWQRLVGRLPLQQPGQDDHLNLAVEYLVKNEHVTGQILVVDGGYQLL